MKWKEDKMGKKILTWILAIVMVCMILPEGVYAAGANAQAMTEENVEIERNIKPGGLKATRVISVDDAEFDGSEYEMMDAVGSAQYRSTWDIYSTNYYYNQLNSSKRALWDALDAMCLQYLTGNADVTGKFDNYYYTAMVSFSNMTKEEAAEVANIFKYSNPQYYFLDLPILYTNGANRLALTVYPAFINGAARAVETNKFKAAIDAVVAQMQTKATDLEKEQYAHDWICQNVTYGNDTYDQVAYGVFVGSKRTVCAGYAQSFQLLCNAVGIDTAVQTSIFVENGVQTGHEWNIIKLDNNWYYVDCTWDDLDVYQTYGYMYFNRSFEMLRSASLERLDAHLPEARWNPYLPVSKYDSGATLTSIGTIAGSVGIAASPSISISGNKVTITVPNGTTVYYTIDGTTPSAAYARALKYTEPFTVKANCTIKAVAVQDGAMDSAVVSKKSEPKYTVTLNANGGYLSKKSTKTAKKTVSNGKTYGSMKTPMRAGYVFTGWYTKKSGGSKITSTSKVTITKNTTLYAHWCKVNTKKATISKLSTKKAGNITVKIKNISTASGYQIRYSLKSSMASAKTKTAEENTKTISGLKKGKTYYVQVRMYQKESVTGKKSYGKWSSTKKIKTKK